MRSRRRRCSGGSAASPARRSGARASWRPRWASSSSSAVPYAAWGAVLQNLPVALTQTMLGGPAALLGALVFGAAAGLARERSESVIAPILLHWMGIAAVLLARAGCM